MRKLCLLALLGLTGCSLNRSLVSTNAVGTANEVPIGTATGHTTAYYLFGIGISGDDTVGAAIDQAMDGTQADAMSNLVVDQEEEYILIPHLFSIVDTRVRGTLVKYLPNATYGFTKNKGPRGRTFYAAPTGPM